MTRLTCYLVSLLGAELTPDRRCQLEREELRERRMSQAARFGWFDIEALGRLQDWQRAAFCARRLEHGRVATWN